MEIIDLAEKKVVEGYEEFAVGNGWIGGRSLFQLFVFFHTDGRIATYEPLNLDIPHYTDADGSTTSYISPFRSVEYTEREYTEREFQEHLQEFQIGLCEKRGLEKLL